LGRRAAVSAAGAFWVGAVAGAALALVAVWLWSVFVDNVDFD
jgi:hypothetical protein